MNATVAGVSLTFLQHWNWRLFCTLEIAGVCAVVAVLPYALALQGPKRKRKRLPIPLPFLLTLQTLQNAILLAVFIALGMWLAPKAGLGAPLISTWTRGQPANAGLLRRLPLAALWGVFSSVIVILLDKHIFAKQLPHLAQFESAHPAAWKGFLASFYGGIDEEILLRFGVMTLLAFGLGKVLRTAQGYPTAIAFWVAIVLAAVLFGLGHLPATARLMPLTKGVIARALLLNGIPGVVCGALYWRHGLESAMLSHFSADIILHVIAPLV